MAQVVEADNQLVRVVEMGFPHGAGRGGDRRVQGCLCFQQDIRSVKVVDVAHPDAEGLRKTRRFDEGWVSAADGVAKEIEKLAQELLRHVRRNHLAPERTQIWVVQLPRSVIYKQLVALEGPLH